MLTNMERVQAMTVAEFAAKNGLSTIARNRMVEWVLTAEDPQKKIPNHRKMRALAETTTMRDFLAGDRIRRHYARTPKTSIECGREWHWNTYRPDPVDAFLAEGLTRFGTVRQEIAPGRAATISTARARYRELEAEITRTRRIIADEYRVLIGEATTADQARLLYEESTLKETRVAAMRRWIELCASVYEISEAYYLAYDWERQGWFEHKDACNNRALERWFALSMQAALAADTLQELRDAHSASPWFAFKDYNEQHRMRHRTVMEYARKTTIPAALAENWYALCNSADELEEISAIVEALGGSDNNGDVRRAKRTELTES